MDKYKLLKERDNIYIVNPDIPTELISQDVLLNKELVLYSDIEPLQKENERLNQILKDTLDYYINVMGDVTGKIIPCDIADEARRLGVIE